MSIQFEKAVGMNDIVIEYGSLTLTQSIASIDFEISQSRCKTNHVDVDLLPSFPCSSSWLSLFTLKFQD